jgi:bacterioferritin-associated ferredoxin
MYVCLCKGLTEADVQRAAQRCAWRVEALRVALELDDDYCCGRCAESLDELLGHVAPAQERPALSVSLP